MATNITDIHTKLLVIIAAALGATYNELPDPYDVEENPELYLKAGYGLAIGPGNRNDEAVSCRRTIDRAFTIVLTHKITTTRVNTTSLNSIQTGLMEAQEKVLAALSQDTTLTTSARDSDYESDTGVVYIETKKYFRLDTGISVKYSRPL